MLLLSTKFVVSISAGILTWVYHTGGYSYMGGRYNRHYSHLHSLLLGASLSLFFHIQGGTIWVLSLHLEYFVLCVILCHFSHTHLSEISLLSQRFI